MIEVMIVLVIMTSIAVMIIPRIGNKNNQIKETVRRFSVLTREIRSKARLENATYRLVIDMHEGGNKSKTHQYWLEKSTKKILLRSDDDRKEVRNENGDVIDPDGFEFDDSILKKKQKLQGSLFFEDVEVSGVEHPIKAGKAYIHFFPEGLVQEAVIHVKMTDKIQWSLALHPLTGKCDIVNNRIELKDLQVQ